MSDSDSFAQTHPQEKNPPTRERQPQTLAYVALAIGILCIGFSAIFVKLANVPGPVSAFYRIAIAASVLVPWWLLRERRSPARRDVLWSLAGGVLFAFDLAFWNTSLLYTSAATATVLANCASLWVGIASFVLLRERLPAHFWLGLAIALTGMSVLVGLNAWRTMEFNRGDLLAIGGSIFYAAYLLTTQRTRVRVDTITFMAISIIACFLTLLSINLATEAELTGFSPRTWSALVGLGLISHLGGWLSINFALGHLRAAPVSVTLLGQAVVTALVSIPILGEFLSVSQLVGGALALAGIALANRRGNRNHTLQVDFENQEDRSSTPEKRPPRSRERGAR